MMIKVEMPEKDNMIERIKVDRQIKIASWDETKIQLIVEIFWKRNLGIEFICPIDNYDTTYCFSPIPNSELNFNFQSLLLRIP